MRSVSFSVQHTSGSRAIPYGYGTRSLGSVLGPLEGHTADVMSVAFLEPE